MCACSHTDKNGIPNWKPWFLIEWLWVCCETSKLWKHDGIVYCSVQCGAVSCRNHREKFTHYWASPSEEKRKKERKKEREKERRKKDKTFWLFCCFLFQWCFSESLGVLLVMKTLKDGWKVEIWKDFLYYHILRVHTNPTYSLPTLW